MARVEARARRMQEEAATKYAAIEARESHRGRQPPTPDPRDLRSTPTCTPPCSLRTREYRSHEGQMKYMGASESSRGISIR